MHKFLTLSQDLKHVFIFKKQEGNKQKQFWRRAFEKGSSFSWNVECYSIKNILYVFSCAYTTQPDSENRPPYMTLSPS